MSTMSETLAFNFAFQPHMIAPSQEDIIIDPVYSFDPTLLELTNANRQARPSSKASSTHSNVSSADSTPVSVCSRQTTSRASPPFYQHGPVLLPKIRNQDQHISDNQPVSRLPSSSPSSRRMPSQFRKSASKRSLPLKQVHPSYNRGYMKPETLSSMALAHLSSLPSTHPFNNQHQQQVSASISLLNSPVFFNNALSTENIGVISSLGANHTQMPFLAPSNSMLHTPPPEFPLSSHNSRAHSPVSLEGSPAPVIPNSMPSTTIINYLTEPNSAASLVRSISFPLRDPSIKHFWWDVRNVRPWSSFNAQAILSLPGASTLLTTPVSASALLQPSMSTRNPETESSLHNIYASYYLPKLNAALAISSTRPLQFSVPTKSSSSNKDLLFVANAVGEPSTAATIFGGKPMARVVGLVRSFDRFNTGMRVEGNVKRVEYLRGLSSLHHAMREHGCRYGFIFTEIELVLVRCGTETTPYFGDLEVTSVQLSVAAAGNIDLSSPDTTVPLTASLALWGLCQLAGDDAPAGCVHWKTEIGAPAEGTRRKAKPRDTWMPNPQLAEKREAKRSRGWIWPEDSIGRKELGKRGVKYCGV